MELDDSEHARRTWEVGEDRVERFTSDSKRRAVLERVIDAILYDLEKRIGQSFSSAELARAWERADDWCQEIAHSVAPDQPWAWNMDLVQAAAFHRFSRRAYDYQT